MWWLLDHCPVTDLGDVRVELGHFVAQHAAELAQHFLVPRVILQGHLRLNLHTNTTFRMMQRPLHAINDQTNVCVTNWKSINQSLWEPSAFNFRTNVYKLEIIQSINQNAHCQPQTVKLRKIIKLRNNLVSVSILAFGIINTRRATLLLTNKTQTRFGRGWWVGYMNLCLATPKHCLIMS
jgi:hypothetical protein